MKNATSVCLKTESLSSGNFSRILLIKPSALGDVVHTIPVLPKLRARFPAAQIDWLITPESRIGLVGANGTGKSTIMKILAGLESLDYGSISRAKGISAGYLPQDGLTLSGRSIFDECISVFAGLHSMEKEMESLTHSMSELDHTSAAYADVADRYQKLEHEFRARDGSAHQGRVL